MYIKANVNQTVLPFVMELPMAGSMIFKFFPKSQICSSLFERSTKLSLFQFRELLEFHIEFLLILD
jgi:hypothetical protein